MVRAMNNRSPEIDELLLRIRGLVRVRELLRDRGASDEELEEHSAEIGRLHWRLAQLVRRAVADEGGRAA
jgi:hypothetical protein